MTDIAPPPASLPPIIKTVSYDDLRAVLAAGWSDFRAAPAFGLFFGGIYALGGMVILWVLYSAGAPLLILPLAIGFPLLGPFVAAGLYEVSRRLEMGEPLSWPAVLGFMAEQRRREFSWMAFIVLFIFWMWMYQVRILIALFLGSSLSRPSALPEVIFGTTHGWLFLAVGTAVGAVLALILYAATVIAMPLLIEREYDIVTAIITSVKAIKVNAGPMLAWGGIVAAITTLAMIPAFMGLVVALPVLGHATWHLYRRVVA